MHKAITITISDDNLTAAMIIKGAVLEKVKDITYPGILDVLNALEEVNVVYGIDKDKIIENLKYKDVPIIVAKGKPMVQTIQDKICYTFEDMRNKKLTPTILADEKANFYDMVKFQFVQPKELLVFVKKGRKGVKGHTVTGKEIIPEDYQEISVDLLKKYCSSNVEISPEGIISKIYGVPLIDFESKVSVDETYIVKGDVDFNTGSISYDGPIIVKGSILNNFMVKSPKDLLVEGIVDGGIIEVDGQITIMGGVNKAKIIGKKNVAAKYIYSAQIETEGSVIADEAILNSNIKAKSVIAKGEPLVTKSGQISGGHIMVSSYIWAKSIGSASSNYTELFIQSFIDKKPYEEMLEEKEKTTQELQKIYKVLSGIAEVKKKTSNLPPDLKNNEVKVVKLRFVLEKKLQDIKNKLSVLEAQIEKEDRESLRKLFVTHNLFSKVLISINSIKYLTKQDFGPSVIRHDPESNILKISPASASMTIPKDKEEEV